MPTEQLKIDAVLDTKNLKRESKDAAQEMTSDLNQIGNAANNAAQKIDQSFASSFEKINAQAKSAQKMIGDMAAVAMGAQAANMIGGAIGQSQWGQTSTGKMTSSGLTGAASGAMAGMSIGTMLGGPGIGTAIGALVGAGKGLIEAANELKQAARDRKMTAQEQYEALTKNMDKAQADRNWNRRLQSYADTYGSKETQDKLDKEIKAYTEELRKNQESQVNVRQSTDKQIAQIRDLDTMTWKRKDKLTGTVYEVGNKKITQLTEQQAELQKKLNDLLAIRANAQSKLANEDKGFFSRYKDAASKLLASVKETAQTFVKNTQENIKTAIAETKEEMSFNKERQSGLQSMISNELSKGRTITDSLVRVGGGRGYGQINSAINTNVAKIVTTLNQLLKSAQSEYTLLQNKLDNLNNQSAIWSN